VRGARPPRLLETSSPVGGRAHLWSAGRGRHSTHMIKSCSGCMMSAINCRFDDAAMLFFRLRFVCYVPLADTHRVKSRWRRGRPKPSKAALRTRSSPSKPCEHHAPGYSGWLRGARVGLRGARAGLRGARILFFREPTGRCYYAFAAPSTRTQRARTGGDLRRPREQVGQDAAWGGGRDGDRPAGRAEARVDKVAALLGCETVVEAAQAEGGGGSSGSGGETDRNISDISGLA
jgi:hypothetical protein